MRFTRLVRHSFCQQAQTHPQLVQAEPGSGLITAARMLASMQLQGVVTCQFTQWNSSTLYVEHRSLVWRQADLTRAVHRPWEGTTVYPV